ncbi:MAG TPA: metal ABC transporter ATP-binding protein [Candidatus Polarisedimenticolia bacterium]|nr:metal ABC transporter ATP-binding protein [Candidatus Polarisedimenticolia bacterium]
MILFDSALPAVPTRTAPVETARETALEVHGLTVSYHETPVLRNVSLSIPTGQLVAVVGPNGAGKSTLLKAVLGLIPRDAGEVRVFGKPIRENPLIVAYVPQTESVDWDFPVTAREVVMMGRFGRLGYFGRPGPRDREIVAECLRTVSMQDFADRHIRQLSGGQQQRIFLARALAQEARILLLDEPLAGVDAQTEATLFELMGRFSAEGKTLVVVNHDLEVLDKFHAVLFLNQSVIAYGPVPEVVTKRNLRRTYGGRMRFLDEAERQLREVSSDAR